MLLAQLGLEAQLQDLQTLTADYLLLQGLLARQPCYLAADRGDSKLRAAVLALLHQQLQQRWIKEAASNAAANAAFNSATSNSYYKILALDGGSVCSGLAPSYVLLEIEARLRRPIASLFNAVVASGNSSCLAAGLALAASWQQRPLYIAAAMLAWYETTVPQHCSAKAWYAYGSRAAVWGARN